MEIPSTFAYAFGKLETAIEELVGEGDIQGRLYKAGSQFLITQAEDFPVDLRQEHTRLREKLIRTPTKDGLDQGTIKSVHALRRKAAGELAHELFSFYTDAAEVVYRRKR